MKSLIWLSFDLGVSGDYENMYAWLDEKDAKECGDSTACITLEHNGDIAETLKTEVQDRITLNKRSRVYIVYRDEGQNRFKGHFIIGRRKNAPWNGYGIKEEISDDLDF